MVCLAKLKLVAFLQTIEFPKEIPLPIFFEMIEAIKDSVFRMKNTLIK
jgi:hypothetical protein